MGFFLSSVREDITTIDSKLGKWMEPIDKVKEYHGVFKSVCDNFIIKRAQFAQIFGSEDKILLWQKSQTINALQIFCGLIYYASDGSFKSKLKFLFMLLDFNEIKSISIVELECMILSICNFTYKLLGKSNTKADELKLAEWLIKYFNPRKRINVTKLYHLCTVAPQIKEFLRISKIKIEESFWQKVEETVDCIYKQEQEMELSQRIALAKKQRENQINTKLSWFSHFCKKLTKPKYKKEVISNTHLGWVYGIELARIHKPFKTIGKCTIIYAISSKMIVYSISCNTQRIYSEHNRQIECFSVKQSDNTVASAEGDKYSKIYIWNYKTLETRHIINIQHQHKVHLMSYSLYANVLATVGERENSPIHIFETNNYKLKSSFCISGAIIDLLPFYSPLNILDLPTYFGNYFILCQNRRTIVVNQNSSQFAHYFDSNITAMAVTYVSQDCPYLRYFNNQNLRLFIITGHMNGSVFVSQYNEIISTNSLEQQKLVQIMKLEESITYLRITSESCFIVTGQELRVYDLTILLSHEDKTLFEQQCPRVIKLNEMENLKLLSNTIKHMDLNDEEIHLITSEGDFIVIEDREIIFEENAFHDRESIRRVNTIVKFNGEMKAICFAEKELNSILLVVSEQRKIFQINPQNHQISLVVDINYEDSINVIDSAVSEEGVGYMIYGCKSGKLLIRLDWQEVAKVYDCGAEINDLKISNDTSYLLVATVGSLMFFQLTPTFSSPRKITFENESPICINFLDNFKFCSVSTSAKNVYLIEIPQLKHRNIQKESETFSITKMEVIFPNYTDESNREIKYTKSYVGGDMKFYMISLTTGEFLYFPSMSCLNTKNYLVLKGHHCDIANVIVEEGQRSFYTLGKGDQMLLEWAVTQQRPPFSQNHIKKINVSKNQETKLDESIQEFKRLKYISDTIDIKTADYKTSTFFFRGTKVEKLNVSLHKSLNLKTETRSDYLNLMKRHCNTTLQTRSVYGLQTDKINQVRYLTRTGNDNRIIYTSSRFLIQSSSEGKCDKIHETIASRISFFDISQLGEIIYCQCSRNPHIYINGSYVMQTTHQNGIIHFSLYHDFILSYGISQDYFTINLHNFRTGQLILERTTYLQILAFVIINEREFVSLNEVRKWEDLVTSEPLGFASAAVLLSNGKDVCLGGLHGQLSILSENGIYEVAANAHSKAISVMKLNKKQSGFELITAGQEEVLKIWNQYFQQIAEINLSQDSSFGLLKEQDNNFIAQRHPKPSRITVKSIDCKNNKILISLSYGQIWEYTITYNCGSVNGHRQIGSQVSLLSQSDPNISQDEHILSQKMQVNYKSDLKKILDAHCSQSQSICKRYIVFDVHSSLPILASAGNDGRLIFRDYETDDIIGNYLCQIDEKMCIRALRFSPRGRMLVVGMSNGLVMTFFMQCLINSNKRISEIKLKYFQTFKAESQSQLQILAIQFNTSSDLFAVSYMLELTSIKNISSGDLQEGQPFIKCFKLKLQRSQNSDQAFYQLRDNIYLKEDQKINSKFSKCVLSMHFERQDDKNYLLIYEEYIDDQGTRALAMRGKHSVYCFQDKSYIVDQFSVDWLNANFASLINLKIHDSHTEEQHQNYSFTCMLKFNNCMIYGGVDGKLHLVRLQSLDLDGPIKDYKIADMCLSRAYSSHTSFITDIKIAQNVEDKGKKYLFVAGYTDQCLIKYQIVEEEVDCFQEYQAYPREMSDDHLHGEFVNKNNFYLMINNFQPLREEITNILEDVQKQPSPSSFKIAKVFGRRASDRRYNLVYYNDCALYSLGPNIVIQNLQNPSVQELMKADPSPYSHCPQISAFHYNDKLLIIATQQQRSSLYVWDIKSKSCISSMKVECSFIYGIRFSGQNYAVFYGINDKFQLMVALVDWKNRKTLGKMRMAYSGNWTIRDICTIQLKGDNKEFITCGNIHLCYWEIRGDTLVYRNFNSLKNGKYMCVRDLNGYVITGCEQGNLYLWYNFQLIHQLEQSHQAAIRCLEVDLNNELIISGGKDGLLLFVKIDQNKLCLINRVELNSDSNHSCSFMQEKQVVQKEVERAFKVEFQVQSICPNPIQVSEQYQTLLVGTRSGNIYQIHYSDSTSQSILLFENHDYQTIMSVAFSKYDEEFFYTVTNAGIIERWNLNTFVKELSFDLGQRALQIDSCLEYLMVCCRNDVLVYAINKNNNMLSKIDEMCIQTRRTEDDGKDCEIIKFCLSKDKRNLALCIKMCSKEPTYLINIYQVGKKEYLFQLNNLKHEIDYLDFSSDQKYLLFKDKYQEIGMINLEKDYRRINTIFVEMNIEWEEEGLRISPKGQKIYYSYSCENKITAITRLGSDKIIVGDQMGTIRVFEYPCPDDKLGELHLQCYTSHMNDITNIKVHHLCNYVITTALQDRSLILWKIEDNKNDESNI